MNLSNESIPCDSGSKWGSVSICSQPSKATLALPSQILGLRLEEMNDYAHRDVYKM